MPGLKEPKALIYKQREYVLLHFVTKEGAQSDYIEMTPVCIGTLTDVEVDVIVCFSSVSVFNYTHVVSAVGFFSILDV